MCEPIPHGSRYREVPSNHEEHQNQSGYQNDGTHRDAEIDLACLHDRTGSPCEFPSTVEGVVESWKHTRMFILTTTALADVTCRPT